MMWRLRRCSDEGRVHTGSVSKVDENPGMVWFWRDLRLEDNPAWATAIAVHDRIVAVFVIEDASMKAAGNVHRDNRPHVTRPQQNRSRCPFTPSAVSPCTISPAGHRLWMTTPTCVAYRTLDTAKRTLK
jgi:hypothetical protein